MRKYLLVSVLVILCATAYGQDRNFYEKLLKEGDRYFEQEQYSLAIQFYTEALELNILDAALDYKLAEAYRFTFNYVEAEVYYLKVYFTDQRTYPLSLYYYALMLKLNGNLSEASKSFDQFIMTEENNTRLRDFVEQAFVEKAGCEIARQESGLPVRFKAQLLPKEINTTYNDFAPAVRDTATLVITSSRVAGNRTLIDERYGEAFTDNYYFQKIGGVWENKTRQLFSKVNSQYNDGSGTFTKKGDQYFFTVCEATCEVLQTRFENDKWTTPERLSEIINYPAAETKQPAISPGGDTLFFVSNRPGGFGQYDIWMSVRQENNAWGEAVNAGKSINTKANELAPVFTGFDNVLFFASDGHPGYGGLDLYMAKKNSGGDTVLYNLDYPFNSVRDDCFLSFNKNEMLWSSNRTGGYGGFDIYAGRGVSVLALVSKLSLQNRNDSRMVSLTSRTAKSDNVNLLASRNEETIDYNNLTYEKKSLVNKMVENRVNNVENTPAEFADLSADEFEILNELSHNRFQALLLKQKYASTLLTQISKSTAVSGAVSITGQLVNIKTGLNLSGSRVLLTDEFGEILKITQTNEEGKFRFTDVQSEAKLFLRLENTTGHQVHARVQNIAMNGSEKATSSYVENVYFDFDHYLIRPEAAQVLGELADYLQGNPGAQVEIYAFADDRGSSAYNFELTQKRGEAVVAYLTRHGVDATSLAIIPKGKQAMKPSATEAQRQYNRRAEFYINGVQENFSPSVKTYILKKGVDWSYISKETGVSREELLALNGSLSEEVKAFQPVRLPINASGISEDLFFVGM